MASFWNSFQPNYLERCELLKLSKRTSKVVVRQATRVLSSLEIAASAHPCVVPSIMETIQFLTQICDNYSMCETVDLERNIGYTP